eukprot:15331431-Ditylum_brightwellii.AAC.1
MPAYLNHPYELKNKLTVLNVPQHSFLLTADVIFMYTNIPSDPTLAKISKYIENNKKLFPGVTIKALKASLYFLMKHNILAFDNGV